MNQPDDEIKKNDIKKQKRKLRNIVKAPILNSSLVYVRFLKNTPSPVHFCTLFGVLLSLQGVPSYFLMAST